MKRLLSVLVVISLLLLCSCTQNQNPKQKKDYQLRKTYYTDVFDTIFSFYAFTDTQDEFDDLADETHEMLKQYHKLYDVYNEYDDMNNLRTINNQAGIQEVKTDQKIIDLIKYCKEMCSLTKGTVDCTYGRVLSIWHQFIEIANDEENPIISMPNENDIDKALKSHGWDNIEINEEQQTIYIKDKDLRLNVGAIAKGYAAQQTALYLRDKGIQYAAINLGGNVTTIGGKGDAKTSWKVGIANPEKFVEEEYKLSLDIIDQSVATSGDYERFYDIDDQRINHIIDLKTGFPAHNVRSVSVITSDAGYADTLSTALFIMSLDEGKELVESLENVEALWILNDGKTVMSSGFKSYVSE